MKHQDALINVVEDGHDANDLEDVVDGPIEAMPEEEEEKGDADVLENDVGDYVSPSIVGHLLKRMRREKGGESMKEGGGRKRRRGRRRNGR